MRRIQKNFLKITFSSYFILLATTLFSQQNNPVSNEVELKLLLQIRPKAEFRNAVFTPILNSQKPAAFVSQRNRLSLQVFSYDDERILGALNWHNVGRKYDAALFMFEKNKGKTHVALNDSLRITALLMNQARQRSSDSLYNYNLDSAVKLIGGYGHMLSSTSMKYIKNITDKQQIRSTQNWVWLSVVINPEIKLFTRAVLNI